MAHIFVVQRVQSRLRSISMTANSSRLMSSMDIHASWREHGPSWVRSCRTLKRAAICDVTRGVFGRP